MQTIILDRDGVINEDEVRDAAEWQAIPGSLQAVARLSQQGYRVVLAINQGELAGRKFSIEDFNAINQKMLSHLAQFGGIIEAIFFCPCGAREHDCHCRKPKPDMLNKIASRLRINLEDVPCVGDRLTDLQAARAAGCQPVLVRTGRGEHTESSKKMPADVPVYDNLAAYVDALLGMPKRCPLPTSP